MDDDATRWDARYANAGPCTALPPDVLVDHPDLLHSVPDEGLALDIACGTGAQSLWLAARGLQVCALDVSPVAVELTRASARLVGHTSIDVRVIDLAEGLPVDLSPPVHDGFDVIVCQRFRQPGLFSSMIESLRPNGIAMVTVLSEVGLHGTAGPFHAPKGELGAVFSHDAIDVLLDAEGEGLASIVIRRR